MPWENAQQEGRWPRSIFPFVKCEKGNVKRENEIPGRSVLGGTMYDFEDL